MRIRAFIFLMMSVLASVCYAQQVSEEQAYQIAQQFLAGGQSAQKAPARNSEQTLKTAYTAKTGRKNDLYVFNRDEGGFVIVSADARTVKPVLGYSDNGRFDADNMPPALQDILSGYQEQIDYARVNLTPNKGLLQSAVPIGTPVVGPLIKTMWSQSDPYNRLCPKVDGGESYTGCVATAMAQIMNYWRWPERGTGSHTDCYIDTLFVDFSKSVYDWDNMAITYTPDTPQVKIDAVSRLMYDCGITVNAIYEIHSGGAYGRYVIPAFMNYFNYSIDARIIEKKNYETEWDSIMIAELDAAKPVLTSGCDHAFICDGYDSEHYFHYNFGWNGGSDGYYLSTAIYTKQISFDNNLDAIIGLYPDYNDECKEGMPVCRLDADGNAVLYDVIRYRDSVDLIIPDSVRIGDKVYPVKSIATHAFFERSNGCKTIIFSETVENIGYEAFGYFKNVSNLHISGSVKSISKAAFDFYPSLESITVDETNKYYYVPEGTNVLMEKGTGYLVRACKNSIIPTEDVVVIGENACDYLENLQVISFPNVTTIEGDAFSDCTNLREIYLGANLSEIQWRVFNRCYSLTDIYFYSDAAPSLGLEAIPAGVTIHVKTSALDSYRTSEWSDYNIVADITDPYPTSVPSMPLAPAATQGTHYYDLLGRPITPGFRGFAVTK